MMVAGLAADAPFYLTYPLWLIGRGEMGAALKENEWPEAPRWMYTLHHVFHSLPVLLIIIVLVRLARKRWPGEALAWGLHILVDIPTHSRDQWAPQFLWPLSDVTVDGISWTEILLPAVARLINRAK